MILSDTRAQAQAPWLALAIMLAFLAPFLIYLSTARSLVAIWNSSETFAHGYVILPISLWLVWRRRSQLARMSPQPCWPALILLLGCGFAWLLAELADVQVVRQYAFVALLPLIAVAVLGTRIAAALAFPLFFLLLAVPFGDIFIAPLIDATADFTVAALRLTGIPVLREGNSFAIPSGTWSVVEACSGLRYLIASITLGALYAHLTYRSWRRQALFMLVAVAVPILANWLRAYMIVMIGHLSGMELATGVDHLIYGWLFFGLVMFLMFWIGSFWREDGSAPAASAVTLFQSGPAAPARLYAAIAAAVACIAIWPLYEAGLNAASHNPSPARLDDLRLQWQPAPPFSDWRPHFHPAQAELTRYAQYQGRQAGLHLRYYRNQVPGAGLISSGNVAAPLLADGWRSTGSAGLGVDLGGMSLQVRESRLQGPRGRLLVWQWYWIDGRYTASDYLGKLWLARQKLLLQGDDGAAILAFAPYEDDAESARAVLRVFLADNLDGAQAALAVNRRH